MAMVGSCLAGAAGSPALGVAGVAAREPPTEGRHHAVLEASNIHLSIVAHGMGTTWQNGRRALTQKAVYIPAESI